MGKLKALPPLLAPLKPHIGPVDRFSSERERHQRRWTEQPWRAWYGTADWKRLRKAVFDRDRWRCQMTGKLCVQKHPGPYSPVAHHKTPHKGNHELFWDIDNIQTVSKAWHDGEGQAGEAGTKPYTMYPKWLKASLVPLTIICGPPCSGKSSYVAKHKAEYDLVIDLDVIAVELGAPSLHNWDRDAFLAPAIRKRNDMLGNLSRYKNHNHAWFIATAAKRSQREWWQRMLEPEDIIILKVTADECARRAQQDSERNADATYIAAREWWMNYKEN